MVGASGQRDLLPVPTIPQRQTNGVDMVRKWYLCKILLNWCWQMVSVRVEAEGTRCPLDSHRRSTEASDFG